MSDYPSLKQKHFSLLGRGFFTEKPLERQTSQNGHHFKFFATFSPTSNTERSSLTASIVDQNMSSSNVGPADRGASKSKHGRLQFEDWIAIVGNDRKSESGSQHENEHEDEMLVHGEDDSVDYTDDDDDDDRYSGDQLELEQHFMTQPKSDSQESDQVKVLTLFDISTAATATSISAVTAPDMKPLPNHVNFEFHAATPHIPHAPYRMNNDVEESVDGDATDDGGYFTCEEGSSKSRSSRSNKHKHTDKMANTHTYNTTSSKSLNACCGETANTEDVTVTPTVSTKQRRRTLSLGGLASVSFMLDTNTNANTHMNAHISASEGMHSPPQEARTFSGKTLLGGHSRRNSIDLSQSPPTAHKVEPTCAQPVRQSQSGTASNSSQETPIIDNKTGLFSTQFGRSSRRISSVTAYDDSNHPNNQFGDSKSAVVNAFSNILTGRFFSFKTK